MRCAGAHSHQERTEPHLPLWAGHVGQGVPVPRWARSARYVYGGFCCIGRAQGQGERLLLFLLFLLVVLLLPLQLLLILILLL